MGRKVRKSGFRCLVCGYHWRETKQPKDSDGLPLACPRCHSPNWARGPKWRWDEWKKAKLRALRRGELIKVRPLDLADLRGSGERKGQS
jgi:hypothetical protein